MAARLARQLFGLTIYLLTPLAMVQ